MYFHFVIETVVPMLFVSFTVVLIAVQFLPKQRTKAE